VETEGANGKYSDQCTEGIDEDMGRDISGVDEKLTKT